MIENKIISVFKSFYWDLKVYRWFNRNKKIILPMLAYTGCFFFGQLSRGYHYTVVIWFFAVFALWVVAGIDHIIIGLRYKKIVRVLKDDHGIEVTIAGLKVVAKDLL